MHIAKNSLRCRARRNSKSSGSVKFGSSLTSSSTSSPSIAIHKNINAIQKTYAVCRVPLKGYETRPLREVRNNLYIWWFPREFCQSLYGENRDGGTNSCTLISLILADKISKERHRFLRCCNKLPKLAIELFSSAIDDGNSIYKRCFQKNHQLRISKNINIPDAMSSLTKESHMNFGLKEWFFTHMQANPKQSKYKKSITTRLAHILNVGIEFFNEYRLQNSAKKASSLLYAALIGDSRTMSFIFELSSNIVAIFDSHQHGKKAGALIAICKFSDILELMKWLIDMQLEIYSSKPTVFEISFLTKHTENPPVPRNIYKSRESKKETRNNWKNVHRKNYCGSVFIYPDFNI